MKRIIQINIQLQNKICFKVYKGKYQIYFKTKVLLIIGCKIVLEIT